MLKKYFSAKKLFLPLIIILVFSFFVSTNYCLAQGSVVSGLGTEKDGCMDAGNCQLNDFTRIAVQVAQIILGISGSAALLAFVIGGVMFLVSSGNKTWIDRGKATITGAVIGLVIVFASWTIIGFIITKTTDNPKAINWYSSDWFTK